MKHLRELLRRQGPGGIYTFIYVSDILMYFFIDIINKVTEFERLFGVYIPSYDVFVQSTSTEPSFVNISKLLEQGYVVIRLRSSLQKFYGRHHELVDKYGVTISNMRNDLFPLS